MGNSEKLSKTVVFENYRGMTYKDVIPSRWIIGYHDTGRVKNEGSFNYTR